jgi:hypothetical protein
MKTKIEFLGEVVDIQLEVAEYNMGGRKAIRAMCDEGPFGVLTVNDPGARLGPGEILVKTWTENCWVPQLLELLPENFKDTGRRVPMGYGSAQVWKFSA